MLLLKTAEDISGQADLLKRKKRSTGFVPTMGALHEGHLSLIRESREQNALTICSIFVNPTQFNDPADYNNYPITIEKDMQMLEEAGTDILFLPRPEAIYPGGTAHLPHYDLGNLGHILEGKYRPGHFQGVCQVMHRLLQLIRPDNLYMGQKDYQQCMVVASLLRQMHSDTLLRTCPTLREPGGLAMSSRNKRLTPKEKEQATAISQALYYIKGHIRAGELDDLKRSAAALLDPGIFRPDYLEIAHAESLAPVARWDGHTPLVALIAAFIGEVRLIDNMPVGAPVKDIS